MHADAGLQRQGAHDQQAAASLLRRRRVEADPDILGELLPRSVRFGVRRRFRRHAPSGGGLRRAFPLPRQPQAHRDPPARDGQ